MAYKRVDGLCDLTAIAAVLATAAILVWQAHYFPDIGYDESAAWLGVRLFRDLSYGFDIDPMSPGFTRGLVMDVYPPVYFIASGLMFLLTGFHIEAARWVSVFFVCATALTAYLVARRFANPGAGLVALAGYLLVPLRFYILLSRPDVAGPLFLLIALWLLCDHRLGDRVMRFAGAGLVYALAVLSHFISLLAGPLFAIVLWRVSGLRFWRHQGFWAFVLAWFAAILAYAALLHPHAMATINSLVGYRHISSASYALNAHWTWLTQLYGAILVGMVLVVSVLVLPPLRRRLTREQALWLPVPLALAGLISFYPNVAQFGYYGPIYVAPLAVAVGVAFAVLVRSARLVAIVGMLLTGTVVYALYDRVHIRVVSAAQRVPLTAPLDFLDSLGLDATKPVLALTNWVFARSARHVIGLTALEITPTGTLEFPADMRRILPNVRPVAEAGAMIVDGSVDQAIVQEMLFARAGRSSVFPVYPYLTTLPLHAHAVFFHPTLIGARYTVFTPEQQARWPALGIAAANGFERLTIDQDCSHAEDLIGELHWNRDAGYFVRQLFLPVPLAVGQTVLLRLVVDDGQGFTAWADSPFTAQVAVASVAAHTVPTTIATVRTDFLLGNGERGRDLLLPVPVIRNSVLTVFATKRDHLKRIEVALPRNGARRCSADESALVAGMAKQIAASDLAPLLRAPPPNRVVAGQPFELLLNRPGTFVVQISQAGRLVQSLPFEGEDRLRLTIASAGDTYLDVLDMYRDGTSGLVLHHLVKVE